MARTTQARGASTRPQETSTLLWLGGGALGVTAIVLGMSVLTGSSTDRPAETPIVAEPRSTAVADSEPSTVLPSPAQPASQDPGGTQRISQRPVVTQRPTPRQPTPQAASAWETPMPAERPQSALAGYFYDLQLHRTDRKDFVQGIMDSEVTWAGYIKEVEFRQNGPTILLVATPSHNTFDIAYIDFPKGFEDKLSDLAVMDRVRIKGLYRGGGPMPHVDGRSVELVEE